MRVLRETRLSDADINSLQRRVSSVGGKATVVEISGVTHYGTAVQIEDDGVHVLGALPNKHLRYTEIREIRAIEKGKPVVLFPYKEE